MGIIDEIIRHTQPDETENETVDDVWDDWFEAGKRCDDLLSETDKNSNGGPLPETITIRTVDLCLLSDAADVVLSLIAEHDLEEERAGKLLQ